MLGQLQLCSLPYFAWQFGCLPGQAGSHMIATSYTSLLPWQYLGSFNAKASTNHK